MTRRAGTVTDLAALPVVSHEVLSGPVPTVARRLLHTILVTADGRAGRVVEVEAYGGSDDPASHAHRGRTRRNATMFEPAGRLYVYRSYGMHWCANVVVGPRDRAAAVLLRALVPLGGLDAMRVARPAARREVDLANGPGKLCAALGVDGADDDIDLLDPGARIRLCTDGTAPPRRPVITTRVGITKGVELPWRFLAPGSEFVSRGRPADVA